MILYVNSFSRVFSVVISLLLLPSSLNSPPSMSGAPPRGWYHWAPAQRKEGSVRPLGWQRPPVPLCEECLSSVILRFFAHYEFFLTFPSEDLVPSDDSRTVFMENYPGSPDLVDRKEWQGRDEEMRKITELLGFPPLRIALGQSVWYFTYQIHGPLLGDCFLTLQL